MKKIILGGILGCYVIVVSAANAPGAYIVPADADDVAITTRVTLNPVVDLDVKSTDADYTTFGNGVSHSFKGQGSFTVDIKQYPMTVDGKYPVKIVLSNPTPFSVSQYGDYRCGGVPGTRTCGVLVGAWLKDIDLSINNFNAASQTDGVGNLIHSYPDTMNSNATRSYLQREGINIGFSLGLSGSAKGPEGSGEFNFSYNKTIDIGTSVSTTQMEIIKGAADRAGNNWKYVTKIGATGKDISDPINLLDSYEAKQSRGPWQTVEEGKNEIPNIAKSFNSDVGQFWKIPSAEYNNFNVGVKIKPTLVAVSSANSEFWALWNNSSRKAHTATAAAEQNIDLPKDHPLLLSGQNFRFKYRESGKCLTYNGISAPYSMEECSTLNRGQYFVQSADKYLRPRINPNVLVSIVYEDGLGSPLRNFNMEDNGTITVRSGADMRMLDWADGKLTPRAPGAVKDGLWSYYVF
ncbi:hypothetical protein [Burkholderia diffusa]|uniref:hypothetical protein n=1 Tax=Burkholderia diffusa TaxID=488732 RepID=UPI00157B7165|nr:hypothetical protein [Burkholderia diffusa]NTY41673.1 hypothetical protein [Burkholderia diffusa]